jgi:hypothetical protein
MVSAKGVWRTEGFPYALDNGAWYAFANKLPFDGESFLAAFDKLGQGADFVVLPDIVAGGERSLEFSMNWSYRLDRSCPQLLAVQDGMTAHMVSPLVGSDRGIFVGGTDEFKETSLPIWSQLARERQCYLHVGRVNTARRVALCNAANADSFDGSSASRYAVTLSLLDNSRRQGDLLAYASKD